MTLRIRNDVRKLTEQVRATLQPESDVCMRCGKPVEEISRQLSIEDLAAFDAMIPVDLEPLLEAWAQNRVSDQELNEQYNDLVKTYYCRCRRSA